MGAVRHPSERGYVKIGCLLGYRLQPRNGFLFRVGVIPIFDFGWKGSIANYVNVSMFIPYLGFGYAF